MKLLVLQLFPPSRHSIPLWCLIFSSTPCSQTPSSSSSINVSQCPLSIGYNDKYKEESAHTKFPGIQIDNHLNWKNHIDQLIPKLSGVCYVVRSLLHISNTDMHKSIYFAHFHSLMKNEIIFWGNSSDSKKVFTLQKKIVRIVVGVKPQNSCRELFRRAFSGQFSGTQC
jgi:hypothetical protein